MCVCVYICMYMYMYCLMYMHTYMYIYIYTCICIYVHMHTYIHAYIYICKNHYIFVLCVFVPVYIYNLFQVIMTYKSACLCVHLALPLPHSPPSFFLCNCPCMCVHMSSLRAYVLAPVECFHLLHATGEKKREKKTISFPCPILATYTHVRFVFFFLWLFF